MTGLDRTVAALLRFTARLLPAGRRQWIEAALAEAAALPAGQERRRWLAGGLRMAVAQASLARTAGWWLAFAAASAVVARISWPGAAASPATLVNRVDVVVIVAMLAGLPLAVRRWLGPAGGSAQARMIRAAGYGGVLLLTLVKASAERFGNPATADPSAMSLWTGEFFFLIVMVGYVAAILAGTAHRSPASPGTLVIGATVGAAAAAVFLLRQDLHMAGGSQAWKDTACTVVVVVVLLLAPFLAGIGAARRVRVPDERLDLAIARSRQGALAGLGVGLTAALFLSAFGTGLIALLPHAAHLLSWAYPMRHLTQAGVVRHEVNVSQSAAFYLLALMFFPLLGTGLAAWGGLAVAGRPSRPGGGGGGGPAPPEPVPPPAREDKVLVPG